MASEGPLYPGAATNNSAVGTVDWAGRFGPSLLDAIEANDGVAAWARDSSGYGAGMTSRYLVVTDFGFAIPTGATIDGILVEMERISGGDSVMLDNAVRIVKGGTIGSTDKSSASVWGTSTTISYGGASDLWGESWAYSDINASNFGFAISVTNPSAFDVNTPQADFVRITVYYTEGGGGNRRRRLLIAGRAS